MAIYRIPVQLQNAGLPSPAMNIWHARVDTSVITGQDWVSPGMPLDALSDFYTAIMGYLRASTTIVFPTSVVDVETDEEAAVGPLANIAGGGAGSSAPPGLAVTCSWRTTSASRRGRGRTFIGPLTQGTVGAGGEFSLGPRQAFQDAADALVAASSAVNGWAFGVYGQESKGVLEPKILRDFVSGTVSAEFAHLRSRRD